MLRVICILSFKGLPRVHVLRTCSHLRKAMSLCSLPTDIVCPWESAQLKKANYLFQRTYKDLVSHHYHSHNKIKTGHTENQQLFTDPSEN